MVVCCKCSRSGLCRNCACVKAGKLCQSCLPSRLSKCLNFSPETHHVKILCLYQHLYLLQHKQHLCLLPVPTPMPSTTTTQIAINSVIDLNSFDLPDFTAITKPTFVWGELDAKTFSKSISDAYKEVVHWRINLFSVPSGNKGKAFVFELARLFKAYAEATAFESIALEAITVLSILALQKPHRKSKSKEHVTCLERRFKKLGERRYK